MVKAIGQSAWRILRGRARSLRADRLRALSPILVIAPHQDDETLGCGGLLATASRLGLKPRVAYLTDGAASHTGSPSWTHERLAGARRREALEALAVLGVAEPAVRFLDWPDARPLTAGQPAYERSLAGLLAWAGTFQPRSLWAPWRAEEHCDHVAAAAVATDLTNRLAPPPVHMDYLVWGWSKPRLAQQARGPIWALECAETVGARARALACHRTQLGGVITDAEHSFHIPPELAALTTRPVELYLERA